MSGSLFQRAAENPVTIGASSSATGRVRYHARWVLPVTAPAIEHGTVITNGDRIEWVGARAQAPTSDTPDRELGEAILVPGLVNAHTHLDLTVMRGLLEELPFFQWIRTLTGARAELKTDDLVASARLGVLEGLRAGITTFADTAPAPAAFDAMRELGVRGIAYREVFGPDPKSASASLDDLRRAVRAMRTYQTPLVRVGVSPHAPYSVSDALFKGVAAYSAEQDLPVAVHVAESMDEEDLIANGAGSYAAFLHGRKIDVAPRARTSIALLERTGILARRALLIHCVRVDHADIQQIAGHGCGVAHCPASNAKLGHGVAPLAAMLESNVHVGLGSDSMASNNRMDLLAEARLAVLAARALARRDNLLDARRALELATIDGARALGMGGMIGSLEVGKQADLAVFQLPAECQPVYEPCDALIWALSGAAASCVVIAGRERVRDGVVIGADIAAAAARVNQSAVRLAAWKLSRACSTDAR